MNERICPICKEPFFTTGERQVCCSERCEELDEIQETELQEAA
jgi:predicted nucleic acid-binding Zn ribbon protein